MTVFGKVLLITGNAEFLADRARRKAIDAIRAADPECEITDARAADLGPGEFAGLTSPSLFSASSAIVVSGLEDLGDDVRDEVVGFAAEPAAEVAVVLLHGGGNKGKAVLDKLRACSSVTEIKVTAPKQWEFIDWLRTEFRSLGKTIDQQAASIVVDAVGQDLRSLAGAADQLAAVAPDGATIDTAFVSRYFGGRAEVKPWEIADAMLNGRIDLAVERARWAMDAKVSPVYIVTGAAGAVRELLAFDAGTATNVPPFKQKILRTQMRNWDVDGLAAAMKVVAEADLDVKGAAADPEYAVERMVIRVASLRKRG